MASGNDEVVIFLRAAMGRCESGIYIAFTDHASPHTCGVKFVRNGLPICSA